MFTLKVENAKGSTLELTDNEENYQVTDISGLNPPNANINTLEIKNGAKFIIKMILEMFILKDMLRHLKYQDLFKKK